MNRDIAERLARYAEYARVVNEVLPADDGAERMVSQMLATQQRGRTKRKLVRK